MVEGVATMTVENSPGASGAGQAIRKTAGAELCVEGRLRGDRDLRLERWWVRAAGEELLRFSAYDGDGRRSASPLYLSEVELIGMLDAGWGAGAFTDFFKRQCFELVARRFDEG